MSIRMLVGDCRETLATLPAGSVQSCITSPPYYGLRDYGAEPLVWGGDPEHEHVWAVSGKAPGWQSKNGTGATGLRGGTTVKLASLREETSAKTGGTLCPCGAWLGSLGLEPTPDLFIQHLVDCFREVRRVLRDDGVLFVNMGDSYAGSGNGSNDHRENGSSLSKNDAKYMGQRPVAALPAKNLMMMPARLALALQADGWWLRSMIPWIKRNSMPESVTDRPTSAVEYWFLLSKSARYFFDADAVKMPNADQSASEFRSGPKTFVVNDTSGRTARNQGLQTARPATGRSFRNTDLFMQSWQGLMLDEDDAPLSLVVNPAGFSGSHFATFPPKLIEPLIKSSTSERGACPECGAPWARVTNTEYVKSPVHGDGSQMRKRSEGTDVNGWAGMPRVARRDTTTGWRPTCAHTDMEPVPCVVLDPFAGAGTTLLVADRLGRNAIGCELSNPYTAIAADRIKGDSPLFVDFEVA